MSAEHQKQTRLLDTLHENELIKAVIIVDDQGRAKGRRGKARCIRLGEDDAEQTRVTTATLKKGLRESVYIAGAGGDDFILVVFDEQVSFDSLKENVDDAIVAVGLKG